MSAQMQPTGGMSSTAISGLGWKPEQVEVIRNSVAKNATPAELYQFLYLSHEYGLDPFKREIYFMKPPGGGTAIITGIDGFRKAAKRDPSYEGVQAFAVREGDEFAIDAAAYSIHHKFGMKRGKVIGAWARADAKGRKPVIVYVDLDEFNKKQMNWNSMPAVMIAKVAESHAIRRQFELGGLYTKEEMGVSDSSLPTSPINVTADSEIVEPDIAETRYDDAVPAAPAVATQPGVQPTSEHQDVEADASLQNEEVHVAHKAPDWKAFWAPVRALKLAPTTKGEQEFIYREASSFFGVPVKESLTEIPDLDDEMLQQFAKYLQTLAQGKGASS